MPHLSSWCGIEVFGLELHFSATGRGAGFSGAAWRGLLGKALSSAVCPHPTPVCSSCPMAGACAYPLLFKPIDETRLPPFWLHGWQRHRGSWQVGIRWLGDRWPAIGEWLAALARDGTGLDFDGAPLRLERADPIDGGRLAWQSASGWHLPPRPLALEHEGRPPDRCQVVFRTPLVSKHAGDPLFGALHTRLQRLVMEHGDGSPLPRPSRPWDCRVLDRKDRHIPLARRRLSGSEWLLELSAIDPVVWPLLVAGTELHAGGQTGMGCGHYALL